MKTHLSALLFSSLLASAAAMASDGLVDESLRLVEGQLSAKCQLSKQAGDLQAPKICSPSGESCRGTNTYECVDASGASVATVKSRFLYRNDQAVKLLKLSIKLD